MIKTCLQSICNRIEYNKFSKLLLIINFVIYFAILTFKVYEKKNFINVNLEFPSKRLTNSRRFYVKALIKLINNR